MNTRLFSLLLVAVLFAVQYVSAFEQYYLENNGTGNFTSNSTAPFVWDFWRINKPVVIGGLIVLAVGVVIVAVVGGIYWYKKKKSQHAEGDDHHDDMHRLEDEDH